MSTLFAPDAVKQVKQAVAPNVLHPPLSLVPPDGPPVPVLQQHGWLGSIGQFAARVQAVTQAHETQLGYRPDAATVLKHAADPNLPDAQLPNLFAPQTPATQALAAHPVQTSPMLLRSIRAFAHNGLLDDWMREHGDQLDAMLKDPATRPAATAALSEAKNLETFAERQRAGGGIAEVSKGMALGVAHATVWAGRTTAALADDTGAATQWASTGGRHGSIAFPELTKTAPAVAQVVKGLVYSPAGLFDVAKAVALDHAAMLHGDFTFKHTYRIALQTKDSFLADLADPGGHAGYLALDLFAIASLGAGTVTRIGRVGEGGLRSAAAPHPLRTTTLEKNGFAEDISLSGSPLTAFLQENMPFFGTKAQQARLSGEKPVSTTLQGEPIDLLGPRDRVTLWAAKVLAPENRIGRAGNIRRNTDFKAAMGLKQELDTATKAAGDASRVAKIASKALPGEPFVGLTKGEVKALQALSWDDPHPLAAEERFHQSMIEQNIGNKAAHEQQIALLGLARKALENPSERFTKSLDALSRIVAETERLRIQMGLGIETADNRIARAGVFLREETPTGMEGRKSATSWYTPTVLKGKPQGRNLAETPFQRAQSIYGFGPPTGTNLFNHEMTGAALRSGDFRTDAHHLAGEGYSRTVRAIQVVDEHKKAWDNGTAEPTSTHDIPIRDIRNVPDVLREAINQFYDGHLDAVTANGLPEGVHQWLFPEAPTAIEHVRWLDPRLLGNAAKPNLPTGPGAKFLERVNNASRPWILYGPKYALNKLGNNSMLALDQPVWRAGQNLARGMVSHKHLSPAAEAKLKSLTGAGRSESYVNPRSGQFSQGLADFWSRMTDNGERKAAFFWYADRKGYHDWPSIEKLLTDDTLKSDLNDIVRRQDESLVAFDRMSPYEKATWRHWVFVYPWTRGATIWAFRTVMEHPAKTAILAQLGQEAYQNDEWLHHATAWMRRVGYIPLFWHGNSPVLGDPTTVNTWSTIAQGLATAKAIVEGDRYAAAGDLFGPGGQFLLHASLGVDQNGNAYPGLQWLGAAEETFNFLPFVSAIKRNQRGTGQNLPAFNPADRASLVAKYHAALKQTVLSPGWIGGFANLFVGGFSGRELNLNAAAARWYRDATPAQQHQVEVQLLNDAVTLQGEYLKQPVPAGVRGAIRDASQITRMAQQEQLALGRSITKKEHLLLTIKYLDDAGRLGIGVGATLRNVAKQLETLPDIQQMTSAVMVKYGHLAELHAWDSNVSTLVSLARAPDFAQRISTLFQHGLASQRLYHLTETQRLDYGRRYIAYLTERADLAQQVKGRPDAAAQLRIFDDQQDKPVGALPSPARFLFSEGPTDQQQQRLDRLVNTPWASLSGVEKAALGRKVPANLSVAWASYQATLKQVRARDGSATKEQKAQLAGTVNRQFPGFMQDWLYSNLPRVERFERTTVYAELPDKTLFAQAVLEPAKQYAAAIKANGGADYYKSHWRDYIASKVRPWLAQHANLKAAVDGLGSGFMEGLVSGG